MMTVCTRCGGLHPINTDPCKPTRQAKSNTVANTFRKTNRWRVKSEQIRARDLNLCRVCMTDTYNTVQQYTYLNLSVHHIVPLAEDPDRGLDDSNLITVCDYHHKLAEVGKIPRKELLAMVASTPPSPRPLISKDHPRPHTHPNFSRYIKCSFFWKENSGREEN